MTDLRFDKKVYSEGGGHSPCPEHRCPKEENTHVFLDEVDANYIEGWAKFECPNEECGYSVILECESEMITTWSVKEDK